MTSISANLADGIVRMVNLDANTGSKNNRS